MKKIFAGIIAFSLILSLGSFNSFAQGRTNGFSDVPRDHWAKTAIEKLVSKDVVSGFPDGTFKPGKKISKAELAVILVTALNLETQDNPQSSFIDIDNGNWACKYIEASIPYMYDGEIKPNTKFYPEREVFREDLIKALIKAAKLNVESSDNNRLNKFADAYELSDSTRRYMNTAVKNKIVAGSHEGDNWYLNPKGKVSRAELAVMLAGMDDRTSVKIGRTEQNKRNNNSEKPKHEPSNANKDFKMNIDKVSDGLYLSWDKLPANKFKYYKVVASLGNGNPVYPNDGYATYITDANKTNYNIRVGDSYTNRAGGDFNKFEAGKKYYIRITAVYENGKKNSNVILTDIPYNEANNPSDELKNKHEQNDNNRQNNSSNNDNSDQTQTNVKTEFNLNINKISNGLNLKWDKQASSMDGFNFRFYKVVASIDNNNPVYPADGYTVYITDLNKTDHHISVGDSYTNGDFNKFQEGVKYNIRITAVYEDKHYRNSNVIYMSVK